VNKSYGTIQTASIYGTDAIPMGVHLPAGTYTFTFVSDDMPAVSRVQLKYKSGNEGFMSNGETKTFENDVEFILIKYAENYS
jgi:hypothetical protein